MGRTGMDLGKTAPFFNDVSTKGMFSQGSVLITFLCPKKHFLANLQGNCI